ncbi:hypothetical protein Ancab_008269 [Ancistrocladus abbreviatus]
MEADDLQTLLEMQREELTAAKNAEHDLDLAFQLQIEEALAASLHTTRSIDASSSSSAVPPPPGQPLINFPASPAHNDVAHIAEIFDEEISRWLQEQSDLEHCRAEQRRMCQELGLLLHDRNFATEILKIPDTEWQQNGDNYARPFFETSGSSSSNSNNLLLVNELFRLYTKGLFLEEAKLAAVGVIIYGPLEDAMFESSKPLVVETGGEMSAEIAEFEALLEGLDVALNLGLKRLRFFCDELLYQYVVDKHQPVDGRIATLVDNVDLRRKIFIDCTPSLVAQNDENLAFKLARAAMVSQTAKPIENSCGIDTNETCSICLEETGSPMMFIVNGCQHRCCTFCMKRHAEVKLLQGVLPKCPYDGCGLQLNVDSYQKLLLPKIHDIMIELVKEASIPLTEKVYCPNPRCSTLMSTSDVLEYAKATFLSQDEIGRCRCIKCQTSFCINCKVPWHTGMSCYAYKRLKPDHSNADAELKSLARRNLWRQCKKCNHMIELGQGCYHITCRCGCEFCYTCGAEWKNKKATCACVLWDEHNLINNRNAGRHDQNAAGRHDQNA